MLNQEILKRLNIWILVMMAASVMASCSLSLIPYTSGYEGGKSSIMAYLIAVLFWMGILIYLFGTYSVKRILRKYSERPLIKGATRKSKYPGIICFSVKKSSLFIYAVVVTGLILIVTDAVHTYIPETIVFPIISVTMLSFLIHCVVDGKAYRVYKLMKESVNNETNS